MIPLPSWVEKEAWDEFVAMRKRMKKPLSQGAAERVLYRLYEIKQAGHDPNRSLVQSADCYWLSVYPPKDMPIEPKVTAQASNWKAEFEAHKAKSQTPEAHEARRKAMERLGR